MQGRPQVIAPGVLQLGGGLIPPEKSQSQLNLAAALFGIAKSLPIGLPLAALTGNDGRRFFMPPPKGGANKMHYGFSSPERISEIQDGLNSNCSRLAGGGNHWGAYPGECAYTRRKQQALQKPQPPGPDQQAKPDDDGKLPY